MTFNAHEFSRTLFHVFGVDAGGLRIDHRITPEPLLDFYCAWHILNLLLTKRYKLGRQT
jgi:hypothetical protein